MNRKRCMILILSLTVVCVIFCIYFNRKNDIHDQEVPVANILEITTAPSDQNEPDFENKEESVQKEEELTEDAEQPNIQAGNDSQEPEILHFVDVFQNAYEVAIDSRVEKNDYISEGFVHQGDRLSYLNDDRYSYRLGIDVSHHQGEIDWKKVKDDGYEFAFLRIGYRGYGEKGNICPDTQFEAYIKAAQEQGLDVGVYFFAQAVNEEEAREEAEFVLKNLEGHTLQLPVVYDPESILDAEARTDQVSGEQFTANTKIFCETVRQAGYEPMIYSNMLWEAYELDLAELSAYEIWYADYEPTPQTPYHFTFWQYSNEGTVSGISGRTDLDIQLIKK